MRMRKTTTIPVAEIPLGTYKKGAGTFLRPFAFLPGLWLYQWAIRTGISAFSNMLRVAPPKIASRKREWP